MNSYTEYSFENDLFYGVKAQIQDSFIDYMNLKYQVRNNQMNKNEFTVSILF